MTNKKIKGFTLAETIITITAIGIIAAITIPIIFANRDQQDAMLYRKATYTVQRGLQKYMDSAQYSDVTKNTPEKFLANLNATQFCEALASQINTKGGISCNNTGNFNNPNFTSMDGIRYWIGRINNNVGASEYTIIKVSGSNGNKKPKTGEIFDGMNIRINYKGKVFTTNDDTYENKIIESFQRLKTK